MQAVIQTMKPVLQAMAVTRAEMYIAHRGKPVRKRPKSDRPTLKQSTCDRSSKERFSDLKNISVGGK